MRDGLQPDVKLGDELQLNLIELKKADRLGIGSAKLKDWITLFEHWKEEDQMAAVTHPTVKKVRGYIRQLSADEEARRLAFVRERAQRDEATLLKEAEARGILAAKRETLQSLIQLKFGTQPDALEARLNAADKEQLDRWITSVLTANNLDELLSNQD